MQNHLLEVERKLKSKKIHDPDYKAFRMKTTNLKVLGHRLPVMKEIVKENFSFYSKSEKEILKIWNFIWKNHDIHEMLYLPLFYYRNKKKLLNLDHWKTMKGWADKIENWEHGDALAHLYSILHEEFPKQIYPTLQKWNKSKNPWKQRLSILSLIYYASKNRKAPPINKILPLVKPLIGHQDKYVNKAVGWTLRESYKLYPKSTYAFIKKNVRKLSANGFSYATEKVTKKQKAELKKLRKKR